MVTNVAVLDDYQSFAPPHFDKLDSNFAVTYIPDTLLPYNHPNTPQTVKDEIVKRLEPFDVISTMRERTPLPADLINRLPNLKLILSCGRRNKAIDMDAAQKRGIPVTAATDDQAGPVDSTTEHIIAMILSDGERMEQVEFTRPRYGLKLGDDLAMVSLAIDGAGGERITRVESVLDPWTKILVSLQIFTNKGQTICSRTTSNPENTSSSEDTPSKDKVDIYDITQSPCETGRIMVGFFGTMTAHTSQGGISSIGVVCM